MALHGEGESHTCDPDQITPKPRPDLQETALESGKVLYPDGSSYMNTEGNRVKECAVCGKHLEKFIIWVHCGHHGAC